MINCPKCGTLNANELTQCKNCGTSLRKESSQEKTDQSDTVFNTGDILKGKYRIKKEIGKGRFGSTFLAEHIESGKELFLKIYFKNSATIWKLIKQELITLDKGIIKGVPRIKEAFSHQEHLCIAEEYIKGKTLWDILQIRIKLTEEEGRYLLVELLKIAKQLHEQEIIHRDIRPKNIILRGDSSTASNELGEVYLIDFGHIKDALLRIKIDKPDREPSFKGYMPREKLQGEISYESDIYAIGMVIAEALTGKLAVVLRTGTEDINLPGIDPELAFILKKMTKYDRNNRFHSVNDVLRAIEEGPGEIEVEQVEEKAEPEISIQEPVKEVSSAEIHVSDDEKPIPEPEVTPPDAEEKAIKQDIRPLMAEEKITQSEKETPTIKVTIPAIIKAKTEPAHGTPGERIQPSKEREKPGARMPPPSDEGKEKQKANYIWFILIGLIILIILIFIFIKPPPEEKEEMEVEITTKPEQASIYTNEVLIDKYPATLILDAQKNEIEIKVIKKGYSSKTEKIVFKQKKEKTNILIELKIRRKVIGGITFVPIKAGTFVMGSSTGDPDERPRHRTSISSFWMSKYEITQAQFRVIMRSSPSAFKGSRNPVDSVNWDDAVMFCKKFSGIYKVKVRLPYEAEWEYACRAGTGAKYYWGNSMNGAYCWYSGNSGSRTHPVGQKRPNAWGLYDMSGNVDEWVYDYYEEAYYPTSPAKNPKGPSHGYQWKVLRGGAWGYEPKFLRSADRYKFNLREKLKFNGFRTVLEE